MHKIILCHNVLKIWNFPMFKPDFKSQTWNVDARAIRFSTQCEIPLPLIFYYNKSILYSAWYFLIWNSETFVVISLECGFTFVREENKNCTVSTAVLVKFSSHKDLALKTATSISPSGCRRVPPFHFCDKTRKKKLNGL